MTTSTIASTRPTSPGEPYGPVLRPGEFLGRYRVLALLGRGGMGEVYRARDDDLRRDVALKVLRDDAADPYARARLLKEARAVARLDHPNVVTVFEVGTDRGIDFVALAYVDGTDASQWLKEKPRGWREVVEVFAAAGRGLAAAHEAGLIHRDFKPSNVLVADGRVLVADFGLATHDFDGALPPTSEMSTEDEGSMLPVTHGGFAGTPAFAAPEQFAGRADERSDQFSFCAALYFALARRYPRGAEFGFEAIQRFVIAGRTVETRRPASTPRWLWRAVLRGLSTEPGERFSSMPQLLGAIDPRKHAARRRTIAAATLGAAGVAAWGLSPADTEPAPLCEGEATLDPWTDGRAAIRERYAAVGPAGLAMFDLLAGALDRYAEAWAHSHAEACRARNDGESQREFEARSRCLAERRHQVRALLDTYTDAEALTPAAIVRATERLPAIEPCDDVRHLVAFALREPDPAIAPRVSELRRSILEHEMHADAGRFDRGIAESTEHLAAARGLGYAPLVAEALLSHAEMAAHVAKLPLALESLREAALLAEESGHLRVLALALTRSVGLEATLGKGPEELEELRRRAKSAVERYPYENLELVLALHDLYAFNRSDDPRGLAAARTLVSRIDSDASVPRSLAAAAHRSLAEMLEARDELEEAAKGYQTALEVLTREFGPHHLDVVLLRDALATVQRQLGRYDESREHLLAIEAFLASPQGRALAATVLPETVRRWQGTTSVEVRDAEGRPVAGAEVVAGRNVRGDGRYALAEALAAGTMAGNVRLRTDADGRAEVPWPGDPVWIVAEHESGRSWPVRIDHPTQTRLDLRPFGRLRVRFDRPPPADEVTSATVVPVAGMPGREVSLNVWAGANGIVEVDRLPIGRHDVFLESRRRGGTVMAIRRTPVEIAAERTAEVVIPRAPSHARLDLVIEGPGGTPAPLASILVLPGRHAPPASILGRDFDTFVRRASLDGPVVVANRIDEEVCRVDVPSQGTHTVCIVPLWSNIFDPAVTLQYLGGDAPATMQCEVVEIEAVRPTSLRIRLREGRPP